MSAELWLLMLVPLVVFVVVELKWGVKAGAITAVILAIGLAFYWYFRFGSIDETLIAEAGLIAVLGMVSVRMRDGRYIKFQPVVMAATVAGYCAYFQFFGRPVLVRLWPTMTPLVPQLEWMNHNPVAQACLGNASFWLIWIFVVHGAIVAAAALRGNSWWWLMARLAIYPLMLLSGFYLQLCLQG